MVEHGLGEESNFFNFMNNTFLDKRCLGVEII